MGRRFPVGKPALPAWCLPGLALVVSFAAHGVWLAPRLYVPKRSEVAPPPSLTAYSTSGSQVWSPILFSLPSSIGFSGAMKRNGITILPPLQSPLDLRGRLDLDPSEFFTLSDLPPPPEPKLPPPVYRPWKEPTSVPSHPVWSLTTPGSPEPEFMIFRFPTVPREMAPVILEGSMVFDRYGQVHSLVVNPPGPPPALAEEILTALRQVRVPRDGEERRYIFRFAFESARAKP